jgi:hypothetical protein
MSIKKIFSAIRESFLESKLFWSLAAGAVLFMLIGVLLGNPFETYSNASTL